jgi:hypothetical protein
MSFIFIVVLRTWKRLTPKNVAAVKGLKLRANVLGHVINVDAALQKQEICGI